MAFCPLPMTIDFLIVVVGGDKFFQDDLSNYIHVFWRSNMNWTEIWRSRPPSNICFPLLLQFLPVLAFRRRRLRPPSIPCANSTVMSCPFHCYCTLYWNSKRDETATEIGWGEHPKDEQSIRPAKGLAAVSHYTLSGSDRRKPRSVKQVLVSQWLI